MPGITYKSAWERVVSFRAIVLRNGCAIGRVRLQRMKNFLLILAICGFCSAALSSDAAEKRVPWTTSRVTGSAEPPPPYIAERAFPKLKFAEPLELVLMPGSGRLFVCEHASKIFSFPDKDDVEKADLFVDVKQLHSDVTEVYSIAFHPGFLTNHYVYIWYILKPELPDGTHISRFKMNMTDPPTLETASEHSVFTWKSGGHNGGCIRFGKDGYMYLATGDGVGPAPPDTMNTGQDISDVLSSILRIDVDHEENGRAYRIPSDNPFVNTPGARGEVWAYGLRNPWRMSFDSATGDLWVGDVGWELWEMIYRIERGGNYGWSIMEGSHQTVKPNGKRGPTPILLPTIEHPHSEASSITGGNVYHGKKFPELAGAYIYGDYGTGKIWELRHDGSRVVKSREIASTRMQIVSLGENRDSELYIVDIQSGGIYRLTKNPSASSSGDFPRKLSETGLFGKNLEPASGVYPYTINCEKWRDYAATERLIGFPNTSAVAINDGRWQFPSNAVLAKTYTLEMERGKPSSKRKIETQLLHFNGQDWNAYSYRWNDQQTDAELVPAAGSETTLTVSDSDAPDGKRVQNWRFHSRAECLRCHNPWCGTLLAFNSDQLKHDITESSHSDAADQLVRLIDLDLLPKKASENATADKFVDPYSADHSLEARARSYLHINCSHCHRENAGGAVQSFMNVEMPLARAGLLDNKPSQGTFGIPDAKVITPGDPSHSILFYRLSKSGKGHMPYLGSSVIDPAGLDVIYRWIESFNKSEQKTGEASLDNLDQQLRSIPSALRLMRALDQKTFDSNTRELVLAKAQTADPLVRDLFERFLPEEKRIKTLGTTVDPNSILSLKGDAARGRALFASEGNVQCQTCHRAEKAGHDFGPDLSQIGRKYNRAQILENILEPSKTIDPQYVPYSIEMKDETVHSGFLISKTEKEIVLKEATAPEVHIPSAQIKTTQTQKLSLMPEGLLQGLTAQDAADLIDYLGSLR
jgi:putative heme-binding domain-containing protein